MSNLWLSLLVFAAVATAGLPGALPPGRYVPVEDRYSQKVSDAARLDALQRARVWREPDVPIERVDFLTGDGSHDGFRPDDEIVCKWLHSEPMSGVTPKLLCTLPDGDVLKIKYSRKNKNDNPEVPAEIAASRLMRALGFGADRMYAVRTVRCFGCPSDPWAHTEQLFSPHREVRDRFLQTFGRRNRDGRFQYTPDSAAYTDFHNVAIERRMGKHGIETKGTEGWTWKELGVLDQSRGGSPPAERDALILMAAFLQHTDNKEDQQRLVCLDALDGQGRCARPMAIVHDLGTTFGGPYQGLLGGHDKFNLDGWRTAPLWEDETKCVVDVSQSMTGTFEEVAVSEAGRRFASSLLNRLTDLQIYELFEGAHTEEFAARSGPGRTLEHWVEVFKTKRAAIAVAGPCPGPI
jgi:hypothetical protein